MVVPVILAGGSGVRLWPLSRHLMPKQFLPLCSPLSLLQATLARLPELTDKMPLVICHDDHRFIAAEQLRQSNYLQQNIVLEPVGRNTAPAAAVAALHAVDDDAILLVMAADHAINDVNAFLQAVRSALPLAEQGRLVTFGVQPTHAETGYGYIRRGTQLADGGYAIAEFVEKPDLATATAYITNGGYYWNSGIFLFKARQYLAELQRLQPSIYHCCQQAVARQHRDLDFIRIDSAAFAQCPSDSIDYAVMEHTDLGVVVPLDAGWSDVGSWASLWDVRDKDAAGNAIEGDVLVLDCHNNLIMAQSALVATVGLTDTIVIQTNDAVLVAAKQHAQQVKALVQQLQAADRLEYLQHRQVFRPWGHFDLIDSGPTYQVKRICVEPGQSLSLQKHQHRAEHWVVLSGVAHVTLNGELRLLEANQSIDIPAGAVHALANMGPSVLEIIEVQTGSYLGEDDIVRLADKYGRP